MAAASVVTAAGSRSVPPVNTSQTPPVRVLATRFVIVVAARLTRPPLAPAEPAVMVPWLFRLVLLTVRAEPVSASQVPWLVQPLPYRVRRVLLPVTSMVPWTTQFWLAPLLPMALGPLPEVLLMVTPEPNVTVWPVPVCVTVPP